MMAGRVQQEIASFRAGVGASPAGSPAKEPRAKTPRDLDDGQVALAAYPKKGIWGHD